MAVSAHDPQEPDDADAAGREPGDSDEEYDEYDDEYEYDDDYDDYDERGGCLRWFAETAVIVVAALVLSALVRAFLIQAFFVPSASMQDTLLISDRIIASKITNSISGPQRGEVVVFRDPGDWLPEPPPEPTGFRGLIRSGLTFIGLLPSDTGKDLVKRVIGVAGDRVSCCNAEGQIELNGVPLVEDYIKGPTNQVQFDTVVPADGIFVMGDNRGDSRDSRFHLEKNEGAVPVDNVVGKVVLILWPLGRIGTLTIPEVFGNPQITQGPQP